MSKLTQKFGTAPVFFTAISTILGAVMFLRFGYAVGNVGLIGTILIVLVGHAVTIPTAMAIAEIATNKKVEGGGEYYIISRSFGLVIGSTIGIALYFSQAISIAFYIMAFTEAFTPLFNWLITSYNLPEWLITILKLKQTIGIPALIGLTVIMLTQGADLGVKTLYWVVGILAISLLAFFIGNGKFIDIAEKEKPRQEILMTDIAMTPPTPDIAIISDSNLLVDSWVQIHIPLDTLKAEIKETPTDEQIESLPLSTPLKIGFFTIFAIIFPAFTGMTAGVGLSGDLKDPGKSLPLGTLAATLVGMVIYILIAIKLNSSASEYVLLDKDNLVMADIAWQGWWLIPLGLAAATISSALGSIMVAPRTLQAIANDKIFPARGLNYWLAKGRGKKNEPYNATILTVVAAAIFILMGAIDSVAEVISMFFMVTYGSLCLISFLNHFAADPAYRPRFKSRWYFSLFGAIACFGLMFFMNPAYAAAAIGLMVVLYFFIAASNSDKRSIAAIFQGVIFQFNRGLHIFLQKADKEKLSSWRPAAIAISDATFQRLGLFELIKWTSQKYGFGTYIHHINGYVSKKSNKEALEIKNRLIDITDASNSKVYVDTLINSSYTSSISQIVQMHSVAGISNNIVMMDYNPSNTERLTSLIEDFSLVKAVGYDMLLLKNSERGYGLKKEIHIWITDSDFQNANLMILLSYIISGHRDWKDSEIKIYACFAVALVEKEKERLFALIKNGQLPISPSNIRVMTLDGEKSAKDLVLENSSYADLTVVGMRNERVKHDGVAFFNGYEKLGNVIFVNSVEEKEIK